MPYKFKLACEATECASCYMLQKHGLKRKPLDRLDFDSGMHPLDFITQNMMIYEQFQRDFAHLHLNRLQSPGTANVLFCPDLIELLIGCSRGSGYRLIFAFYC